MSWWSSVSGGVSSLGSDIYNGFSTVYNAVSGVTSSGISYLEKQGGQMAKNTSVFTQSIFLNWFFELIVYPVVDVGDTIILESTVLIMKGVGIFLGLIFAIPDGIAIWFEGHIVSLGMASPIASSISFGIILVIGVGTVLLIFKILQLVLQET